MEKFNKNIPAFTAIKYKAAPNVYFYGHIDGFLFIREINGELSISGTVTDIFFPESNQIIKKIFNGYNRDSWNKLTTDSYVLGLLEDLIEPCSTGVEKIYFNLKNIEKIYYPHEQLRKMLNAQTLHNKMLSELGWIVGLLIKEGIPYSQIGIYGGISKEIDKPFHKDFDLHIHGKKYSKIVRKITQYYPCKVPLVNKFENQYENIAKFIRDKTGKIKLSKDSYCDVKVVPDTDEDSIVKSVIKGNFLLGNKKLFYGHVIEDEEGLSCPGGYIVESLIQSDSKYRVLNTVYEFCGSTHRGLHVLVHGMEVSCEDGVPTILISKKTDFIISTRKSKFRTNS